jgi:glc operon protein GlcG
VYQRQLLTLEAARTVGEAALAKAMESQESPVAIAVVDATGELVYFVKMDNSSPLFAKMAVNKAYTAVQFGTDAQEVPRAIVGEGVIVRDVDPKFTPMGGVAIEASDGTIIGAIGVSGRKPVRDRVLDEDISQAGLVALSL